MCPAQKHRLIPGRAFAWLLFFFAFAMSPFSSHAAQPVGVVQAAAPAPQEAHVIVYNRTITIFRASFLGASAEARARRASQILAEILNLGGPGAVSVRNEPQGNVLLVDEQFALVLIPEDADRLRGEDLEAATQRTAQALAQVIADTREGRDRSLLMRALAQSLAATAVLVLLLLGVVRARRALRTRAQALISSKAQALKIADAPLLDTARLVEGSNAFISGVSWLLLLLFTYQWLGFVLKRFPYTRPWGEELTGFLVGVVQQLASGVLGAAPDLVVAVVIFLLARTTIRLVSPFFERAKVGHVGLGWLDPDTVRPTRTLFTVAVWLFAIVMAYPYLPGAQSEAFKGMSVLVGLMLTVGGANLIGQAASGLILMYSRTLRVGEFVRLADHEGTVTELGTFTTRIRTGLGEELTMPNALVLGTVTKNYSRAVQGRGYVVDTTVTIGYDTPWRDVESMLTEAASRTPGVLRDPQPRVFQMALSDFYVEYRLVCQAAPSEPRPRAEVLANLHGHIQDVFNEHEVQIMSPHYYRDPPSPKLVPRLRPDAAVLPASASAGARD